ncbi:MAG TPA: glycosyltransferase [Blastocatellia bacterium]|nr:glycosyltransferase [Blastocatellia bacterium]
MLSSDRYHIVTAEYPPQLGGVSDYTGQLAAGLAQSGKDIHVWTIPCERETPNTAGVTVHRVVNNWSPQRLRELGERLDQYAAPRLLLVQYCFNSWGRRGLNFDFGRWLLERRRKGDEIHMMMHEPFYPWILRDRPTRWILAAAQRWMMRTLLAACSKVYLAIPAYESALRPYEPDGRRPMIWLPIPSNVPVVSNQSAVESLRRQMGLEDRVIIGSFSIYAEGKQLSKVLPELLLRHSERVGVFFGRNSDSFVAAQIAKYPQLKSQLISKGLLSLEEASLHLQLCDLLLQPYYDGVSSRRTSVMAGISHGRPIVTTKGSATEPIWSEANCVALSELSDVRGFIQTAEFLIKDANARKKLGAAAAQTYRQYFEWSKTLAKLLEVNDQPA